MNRGPGVVAAVALWVCLGGCGAALAASSPIADPIHPNVPIFPLAGAPPGSTLLNIAYDEAKATRGPLADAESRRIRIDVTDRRPEPGEWVGYKWFGAIAARRPVREVVRDALAAELRKNGHVVSADPADRILTVDIRDFWLDVQEGFWSYHFSGTAVITMTVADGQTGRALLVRRARERRSGGRRRNGRPQQAEAALERSLAIRERRLRPGHPDIADSLVGLGEVRAVRGALSDAENALRRALVIERKSLGDDHPQVAVALVQVAVVLHGLGQDTGALRDVEQALAIQEKRLPPGHPAIADTLEIQVIVLRALGEPERAAAAAARAQAIRGQQPAK